MPRGRRKNYTEKLLEIQGQIGALEAQLKELKAQERELLRAKKDDEMRKIADILDEKNISADELVTILDRAAHPLKDE